MTMQQARGIDLVRGAVSGISSAVLFGISAPLAKLLLPRVDPWLLAGLLYAGAGIGLLACRAAARIVRLPIPGPDGGARLRRNDLPALAAIAVIGGGAGPVLLLFGLRRVSGVAGALLLNLEAVFTMALAVTLFRERLQRREIAAAAVVVCGAVLVSAQGGRFGAGTLGVLAIGGACLAWAIDNNLTARLSRRNPLDLVQVKALTAGAGNLTLSLLAGAVLPSRRIVAFALLVGFVCYGLSIVLDVYALRYVGAARESAFFATAPFAGALASIPILGERIGPREIGGGALMAIGVALLLAGRRRPGPPDRRCV